MATAALVQRWPVALGVAVTRATGEGLDWREWHKDYDRDSPLARRLEIVQRHIGDFLDHFEGSPIRLISMCSGEGRDILGVLAEHPRRDVRGLLVESDPELARRARLAAGGLGLANVEVVIGDAGWSGAYSGAIPADLVLACGVFGNISDADVEATVRSLPELCAPRAAVIWTRHRREPDLTPSIRRWLSDTGFEELAFEAVPDSEGAVGAARFTGQPRPLVSRQLFVFNRTSL